MEALGMFTRCTRCRRCWAETSTSRERTRWEKPMGFPELHDCRWTALPASSWTTPSAPSSWAELAAKADIESFSFILGDGSSAVQQDVFLKSRAKRGIHIAVRNR